MKSNDIESLKKLLASLPDIRWNIAEQDEDGNYIYFGDEWDNWCHLDENERVDYFCRIFSVLQQIKYLLESK